MSEVRFNLGMYSHILIEIPDTSVDENGYVQRIPTEEVTAVAIKAAKTLHEEFDAEQPEGARQEPQQQQRGEDGDPGPEPPHRSQQSEPRPQAPQQQRETPRRQGGIEPREAMLQRSWGDCPDCNQPARASKMEYQEWETTDDGVEVPAKHYCANQQCPRKSIWRRELHQSIQHEDSLPF